MKSGIKKVASGRAMRVATVFTGAAACAAAFTPVAHAATGHQAEPDGKGLALAQLQGMMHGARLDNNGHAASGSIREVNGCAGTPTWVHLAKGAAGDCVGYKGTWSFSVDGLTGTISVSRICGGNNYGWYADANGSVGYYHQGTTYVTLPVDNIRSIGIFGWKGTDTCPAP
jgi:hypothetical protein